MPHYFHFLHYNPLVSLKYTVVVCPGMTQKNLGVMIIIIIIKEQ